MSDLEEARARLREWAYYFRDRRRKIRAGSAEGNWRSPQVWEAQRPKPNYDVLRAEQTHEMLRDELPKISFRALTWRYCYPFLPIGIPLRSLGRYLGGRVTLKEYEEMVIIGEYRVASLLQARFINLVYSSRPSGERRVITV